MQDVPVLAGARTRLRPWRLDDVDAVYAACQDPLTQRFTTVPSPYARSDAEYFVTRYSREVEAAFAVEGGEPPAVAASVTLLQVRDGVGEIGYWAAPWARGRGYVTEALDVVVTWAFTERGVARLELVIEPANAASRAVARRAGFVAERAAGPDDLRDGIREATVHVLRAPAGPAARRR